MKLPSNVENIVWGFAIILVALGTYLVEMFDGNPSTVPSADILIAAIVIGISKMRSATVEEVKEVKSVAREAKREAMVATQVAEESSRGYAAFRAPPQDSGPQLG